MRFTLLCTRQKLTGTRAKIRWVVSIISCLRPGYIHVSMGQIGLCGYDAPSRSFPNQGRVARMNEAKRPHEQPASLHSQPNTFNQPRTLNQSPIVSRNSRVIPRQ